MKHVFVESNWVFDYSAPEHLRTPDAEGLVNRAGSGELRLHIPSICLREGEDAVRRKCTARIPKELSEFRRWAVQRGVVSPSDAAVIEPFLESYRGAVQSGLAELRARVDSIRALPGVSVFSLSDAMFERAIALRSVGELKPFDEAILAAVLEKAKELPVDEPKYFCELDGDLAAQDKKGYPRVSFVALYAEANITFLSDFQVP